MAKITATAGGVTTEHDVGDLPLTVICHQQGIKVGAPEFVEVNPRLTIACMESLNQKQWDWISTGPPFRHFWAKAFDGQDIPIPVTIEELLESDAGTIHVAGMIVLSLEAMLAGKNVFFREPETYLHPKTQLTIMSMIIDMQRLFGGAGGKVAAVADPNPPSDKGLTLKWLRAHDPEKDFARVGDTTYKVFDLICEVIADTPVGKMMVSEFCSLRD
jgi:hypothetical protein